MGTKPKTNKLSGLSAKLLANFNATAQRHGREREYGRESSAAHAAAAHTKAWVELEARLAYLEGECKKYRRLYKENKPPVADGVAPPTLPEGDLNTDEELQPLIKNDQPYWVLMMLTPGTEYFYAGSGEWSLTESSAVRYETPFDAHQAAQGIMKAENDYTMQLQVTLR